MQKTLARLKNATIGLVMKQMYPLGFGSVDSTSKEMPPHQPQLALLDTIAILKSSHGILWVPYQSPPQETISLL